MKEDMKDVLPMLLRAETGHREWVKPDFKSMHLEAAQNTKPFGECNDGVSGGC